jgi:hypothetical protein
MEAETRYRFNLCPHDFDKPRNNPWQSRDPIQTYHLQRDYLTGLLLSYTNSLEWSISWQLPSISKQPQLEL